MNDAAYQTNSLEPGLGLEAFDSLRAEDEPWLKNCFIPPPNMEQIAGERSVIVFGGPGSGKTALGQHLRRLCLNPDGSLQRLVVEWTPSPLIEDDLKGIAAVHVQAKQILDACVESVLQFLAFYPTYLQTAPATSKEVLIWFVNQYSQNDLSLRVEQMIEEETLPGETLLRELITETPRKVLPPNAGPDKVAAKLVRTLNSMGLKGFWVIGNDAELEMWTDVDPDDLVSRLRDFFSALPLFERAGFSYKILLPARLEQRTLAIVKTVRERQRIFPYYLRQWDKASLLTLVNKRLRMATGQSDFTIEQLCNADDLMEWLEWVGDASPREWLEQIKPLVENYIDSSAKQPINQETWYKLRRANPPRLYLDDEGRRVMVGARQISLEGLPAKAYEVLKYLYQQPSDYVTSKAELYYRVYLEWDTVPVVGEEGYLGPNEYQGVIDTILWRIRKAIEPNPSGRNHVLLITVRGHGVQLNTRW